MSPALRSARLHRLSWLLLAALVAFVAGAAHADPPSISVDLRDVHPSSQNLLRVRGSVGTGISGLPVAGGHDCDGDGRLDYAMASMRANPGGRTRAGIVYLVLGDGTVSGEIDTALPQARVLEIWGDGNEENAGSEIWMDDVDGDGLGDLLIARQNYTSDPGHDGQGALTILFGSPALTALAAGAAPLDLRVAPPPGITLLTFIGALAHDRLGIWMRTGDVTGDGIADVLIAADQVSTAQPHQGAAYLVRGGSDLSASSQTIDLASFGATALVGDILRIDAPTGAAHYHFGATCQIGDLDGNGKAEVLLAATLNRAGAALQPPSGSGSHATGGTPFGTLYIAWDDNFGGDPWAPGQSFAIDAPPTGTTTLVAGTAASLNDSFGEELLAGADYDGDGDADLFIGDLTADRVVPPTADVGRGYVLFSAKNLKGSAPTDIDNLPAGVTRTEFVGSGAGTIAADTAMHGDFDCDGIEDIAFSSPHASRLGRPECGVLHVFMGQASAWPSSVDLEPSSYPAPGVLRSAEIIGARGATGPGDKGDVLSYSGAAGDVNGDCRVDLITNEMLGNGVTVNDTGNLIVISGGLSVGQLLPLAPTWLLAALAGLLLATLVQRLR